jgi:hypothetical protein
MKTKNQLLIESYINGNISYVKEQVKKLSKEKRKHLYNECLEIAPQEANFFFNLI